MADTKGQTNLWSMISHETTGSDRSSSPVLVPLANKRIEVGIGMDYLATVPSGNKSLAAGDALVADQNVRSASEAKNSTSTSGNGSLADENQGKTSTTGNVTRARKNCIRELQNNVSVIDIVNHFPWTTTVRRDEVPKIIMKEKYLKTNNVLNQAVYNMLTVTGKLDEVAKRIAEAGNQNVTNTVQDTKDTANRLITEFEGVGLTLPQNVKSFGTSGRGESKAGDIAANTTDFFSQVAGSVIEGAKDLTEYETFGLPELEPYEALYLTKNSGFIYHFPYFMDDYRSITNAFNDSKGGVPKGESKPSDSNKSVTGGSYSTFAMGVGFLDMMGSIGGETIGQLNTLLGTPGTYIEQSKPFTFPGGGESFTFEFPLINTLNSFNDVLRNWQLVFMLIYQNRPNRVSRDRVEPSCIYEIHIPGVRFTPYAYISNLDVQFKGSRREMIIPVNGPAGPVNLPTIIPDAYMVRITVQSLIGETKNLMSAMLRQNGIITTAGTESSIGKSLDNITSAVGNIAGIGRNIAGV